LQGRIMRDAICKGFAARCGAPEFNKHRKSVKTETYFDADLDVHRMTVFLGRLKAPLLNRFNRFGVEAESQTVHHANVPWISMFIHNQRVTNIEVA